jgi:hypothetical protein
MFSGRNHDIQLKGSPFSPPAELLLLALRSGMDLGSTEVTVILALI